MIELYSERILGQKVKLNFEFPDLETAEKFVKKNSKKYPEMNYVLKDSEGKWISNLTTEQKNNC